MARQTRQARRAQERRQQAVRRQHPQGIKFGRQAIAGAAIVILVALFFGYQAVKGNGNAANSTAIPAGPTLAGIGCDGGMTSSGSFHVHAHLSVFRDGKEVSIASTAGHYYDQDCLFWLHAHADANGIIHVEAPNPIKPPLGTWFKILKATDSAGVPNITAGPGQTRKMYVNGKLFTGDPLTGIKLLPHESIVIEIGPPFVKPAPFNFKKYGL